MATPKPNPPAKTATTAAVTAIPKNATPQQLAFITQILPYVLKQSRRTGIPPEVFIIQSGIETGWGTSGWWKNQHNPAGIGVTGQPGAGNAYPNLDAAFADYADKLMGHGEAGQDQFVRDVQNHASASVLLADLQAGPWAAGHYGGTGLTDTLASLYGGKGSKATTGTGGSGGGGGVGLDVSIKDIPFVGGFLDAATWPAKLAQAIVGLFKDWRYWVEVFAGLGMVGLGILIILIDTGAAKKAVQTGQQAAVLAAL